jgi:DNA-binding transcriptional regulator YhcF (GntR family)
MEKEKLNNQNKLPKYSFTIVSDYFLDEWAGVVGAGPTALYVHLLKYCYKGKDVAWPTLKTLSKKVGVAENTLIRYIKILVKYGFIKNIFKNKSTSRNNIYQMSLGEDLCDLKILPYMVTSCNHTSKMSSSILTKCKVEGYKMSSSILTKCNPNNNNLNNNNITTTKRKKDAVVAVDFKKLKEKGEERMRVIRERMVELDFKEEFIEKILKEYSMKKIDEKLDLLMERKNIQSPAGWLRAALKNDYQDAEQERYDEEPVGQVSRQTPLSHLNSTPSMGKKFRETIVIDSHLSPEDGKIQSREKVLKMIRKTRKMLKNLKTKGGTNVRAKISN